MNIRLVTAKAFTLIELLVVLAIAGAVGAMVAPNLWQMYLKSNERQVVIEFGVGVNALRRQLHLDGESLYLPKDKLSGKEAVMRIPSLPSGWVISGNSEIYFLPTGVTNGGSVWFEAPSGSQWELSLQPLEGRINVERL